MTYQSLEALLDRTCQLQRLPGTPTTDAWGQSDTYTTYASGVPCRIELERTGVATPVGVVKRWIIFIFQDLGPEFNDRVVIDDIPGVYYTVLEIAPWTLPGGGFNHVELACEEVAFA